VITLDGYAASHRAVAKLKEVGTLPRRLRVRSRKYLNNVVEQDHGQIKLLIQLNKALDVQMRSAEEGRAVISQVRLRDF
jgi:transposase-like protein